MKRKQFKRAVDVAMGRSKTKTNDSAGKKKAAKYADKVSANKAKARLDTTLRRLMTQQKRIRRLLDRAQSPKETRLVHFEALQVYAQAAAEGNEFARQEKLHHLECIISNPPAQDDITQAVLSEDTLQDTNERLARGNYVVALLQESRVDEAKKALKLWSDTTNTELAYSEALLAYVAWRPNVPSEEKIVDGDKDSDGEGDDEHIPILEPIPEDEADEGSNDPSDDKERAATEALLAAFHVNPHVAFILKVVDEFTGLVDPQSLSEVRCSQEPNYSGSVEEALAYIADAGNMWLDRPGMQEWVGDVVARCTSTDFHPRCCCGKRYLRLYSSKLAEADLLRSQLG